MTHAHEWALYQADHGMPLGIVCQHAINTSGMECDAELSWPEALRRLNAVELLSRSKADTAASLIRGHTVKHDLKAYAAALEGGIGG